VSGAEPVRVAVVGAGPKGFYCFERLAHHAERHGRRLRVDLFEPSGEPGAGAVYRSGQPEYLRMNFADELIDAWPPGPGLVPSSRRRSFAEWRDQVGVRDGTGYSPRSLVGEYLRDCFDSVLAALPPESEARVHRGAVDGLERGPGGWIVRSGERSVESDEVVVAVGHRGGVATELSREPPTTSGGSTEGPAPISYPLARCLGPDAVPAGAELAVRGMALTFIDVALELTEGRGGRFVPADDGSGRLRYLGSPEEVGALTALSRSGRPMAVKPAPRPSGGGQAPALEPVRAAGRERLGGLDTVDPLGPGGLLDVLAGTAAELLIAARRSERSAERVSRTARLLSDWLRSRLAAAGAPAAELNGAAERGLRRSWRVASAQCPPDGRWALGESWRAIYPALVATGSYGGIPDRLWADFAALAREMERLAFGPPPINGAKLLALAEAGKVRFGGAGAPPRLDAVLASPGAAERRGDLVDALLERGWIRRAGGGRRGIEVDRAAGCIGRDGTSTPGLAAVGRLTEDWVIGNDTLSRTLHADPDRWARRVVDR
jgi:uncharacterized NAD(P)/FAD-binding protein YdhS